MSLKTWLDARPWAAIEAEEREERERRATVNLKLFDPRIDVSADAHYIVRNLVIWFLVVPIGFGIIVWVLTR